MSTVPMEIAWQPAWLSWVGSVTTCLEALGVEVEASEVAGVSGYAFALSINRGLCPSGPTCLDWSALATVAETFPFVFEQEMVDDDGAIEAAGVVGGARLRPPPFSSTRTIDGSMA